MIALRKEGVRRMGTWRLRLRWLFRRADLDRELDEELAFYLDRRTEHHLASGLSADEARRAARRDLGSTAHVKEQVRDARGLSLLGDAADDAWYALRWSRSHAGFTAVVVLTLALGIGATTAIFSMVNFLILRPLPVPNPAQLVVPFVQQKADSLLPAFSVPDYRDIARDTPDALSGVIAFRELVDGLSVNGQADRVIDLYVTANFFSVLGVKPTLGRFFLPSEGGQPLADSVMVLSHAYWRTRFGGDPAIVGKVVSVDGHPISIVGVAPAGFYGVSPWNNIDGYLPLGMAPISGVDPNDFITNRGYRAVSVLGRLRPGISLRQAEASLGLVAVRLSKDHAAEDAGLRLPLFPEASARFEDPRTDTLGLVSKLFLGLATLVLLLSCLNVSNMLIVRATVRQREWAVRSALGAGRGRLVRQLLTEGALLGLAGGFAGILLGWLAGIAASRVNLQTDIPIRLDFGFDWRVLIYALASTLIISMIVGIAPVLHVSRGHLSPVLHGIDRGATQASRIRSALVVAQVGGSLMLLVVAGLFTRSLSRAEHTDLGFDPNYVLNFTMDPLLTGFHRAQGTAFFKNLLDRVRVLPGVVSASTAFSAPMSYLIVGDALTMSGYDPPPGQPPPSALYNTVSPDYFATLHIAITKGRSFTDADDADHADPVAIVSEAFVTRYWPNLAPLGRTFKMRSDPQHTFRVVGVAAEVRYRGVTGPSRPYVYVPFAQRPGDDSWATVQIRTTRAPESVIPELEQLLASFAPGQPVWDMKTMHHALYTLWGLLIFQLGAAFAACLGTIALMLTIVGIYGVVSYDTSRKTREIGIRMALGAQPMDVLRMIGRQGLFIVGGGVVAGLGAAVAAARMVGTFLIVRPTDPMVYLVVSAALAFVAMLACLVPGWKAMRTDPVLALRSE
jgi:macrolide transport system ATP-binding/permease protein